VSSHLRYPSKEKAIIKNKKKCVFCEIVGGREPASVIYQDDLIMALMTPRPTRPGEFLIIPKEHIDEFCDIPDELACHIIRHAQRLSQNLRTHLKPKRMGLVIHGFGVSHSHLIVVPQHDTTDITSGRFARIREGKIEFTQEHIPVVPREELDRQARLLAGDEGEVVKLG
jgi:histidine triad (HIT) family protein